MRPSARIVEVHPSEERARSTELCDGRGRNLIAATFPRSTRLQLHLPGVELVEALRNAKPREQDDAGHRRERAVAPIPQEFGKRRGLVGNLVERIVPHLVARRIETRQHRGVRGQRDRNRRKGRLEPHGMPCQLIDVRRRPGRRAVAAEGVCSHRVDRDQEHVGSRLVLAASSTPARGEAREQDAEREGAPEVVSRRVDLHGNHRRCPMDGVRHAASQNEHPGPIPCPAVPTSALKPGFGSNALVGTTARSNCSLVSGPVQCMERSTVECCTHASVHATS